MSNLLPIRRQPGTSLPRRVFFSFCCDEDKSRANVVHDCWRMGAPEALVGSIISEKMKPADDEESKRLIREGIDQASVTCVLVGTHTWQSRWVRYEIARSVERGNGLLAVAISGIADASTGQTTVAGWNPLAYLGVGKTKGAQYFLFENINGEWIRYQDHPLQVTRPTYVPDMSVGYVHPLSVGLAEYDYVQENGAQNLYAWITLAAQKIARS